MERNGGRVFSFPMSFTRRQFLEGSAALVGVSLGGATLAGCGAKEAAKPTARAGADGSIILTGIPALAPSEGHAFTFPGGEPGLIFQGKDGQSGALSAKCTHAGCAVEWDGRSKIPLRCPCHESQFDLDGKVLSGPAKAPLKRYAVSLSGEEITLKPL